MPFPYDKYPWLNFQELNLAYFIKHFREIFQQWDTLLNEMYEWRDATDADLAEWKSTVETGISSWETGLQQAMEDWKDETETDISTWEAATLSALDAWKTATTAVFEQIRTEAAGSAQAAAGSAASAQGALTGAQAAQGAAEAAAAGIQSELAQIQTNTTDISELTTQLNHVVDVAEVEIPIDVSTIPNVETLSGYSAFPRTATPAGIQITPTAGYTTYWFVATRAAQIYFDSTPAYTALTVAPGFTRKYEYSDNSIALACQTAGTRYRTSDGNLPDQSNPVSVSTGDAIAITITENTNVLLYGYATEMVYNPDEEFKEAILNDVKSYLPKKSYVQYNTHSGGTYSEYLSIYLPADNGYIRFEVTHDIDANIKSDIWRINNAFACDDNFANEKQLTAGGEWELAIHLKNVVATGVNGFSGGIYHGKEICDSVKFYLNGEEVDITTLTERTEFIRFTFNQTSSLYHPDDFTHKIAEHNSDHIFYYDVTIKQSLKWLVTEEVTSNYMAMFPVSKTYSNRFSTDGSFIRAVGGSGVYTTVQLARKANILSTPDGIEYEFYTPLYPEKGADFFLITDNNSDRYNKCYYNITPLDSGYYSVTTGEQWYSVTKYKINVV